jgi:hypothetical protein
VYANAGIGVITGTVVAVDNDVRQPDLAAAINELIERELVGAAPQRQGRLQKPFTYIELTPALSTRRARLNLDCRTTTQRTWKARGMGSKFWRTVSRF